MSALLQKRLQALGHASAGGFSVEDESACKRLVVWLEDTKIRHYPMEERDSLRQTEDKDWNSALSKYISSLKEKSVVVTFDTVETRMKWLNYLLARAIALEFQDKAENLQSKLASTVTFDPTHLSPSSIEKLHRICDKLNLPQIADPVVLLRAVASVLEVKLESKHADGSKKQQQFSLDKYPLGFSTGDQTLDKACKVLRLLHISELRDLQTKVNELIVAAQRITANPVTDARLGQIGK